MYFKREKVVFWEIPKFLFENFMLTHQPSVMKKGIRKNKKERKMTANWLKNAFRMVKI